MIALKDAGVSERVIHVMVESAVSSEAAPPSAAPVNVAREAPSPAGPAAWVRHNDPAGFSIEHPATWRVVSDAKLGRFTVQGDKGERLILWPAFLDGRQVDDAKAAVLALQLARTLEPQTAWSAPTIRGRYAVVGARMPERKAAAMLTWSSSRTGTAIVLYEVAAPAGVYAGAVPVFASMLRSFRISQAPAGTQATRISAGAIQYVRWTDPLESAFSASVPSGWKALGGMYRFSATDTRPLLTLLCPSGGILIRLGQIEFGAFMEPIRSAYLNLQSGSLPFSDGSRLQIMPYASGQQFAATYVQRVPQECAAVRITASSNRTDLVNAIAQQAASEGVPSGQITAGDVNFTCNAQGAELRGYYRASTIRVPTDSARRGMGGALWYVYRIGGYVSRPELQQDAAAIAQQVVHSLQVNPQWAAMSRQMSQAVVAQDNARSQALRTRAFAAMAENERQTSNLISSSYWAQKACYDEISRRRENGILGTVGVVNPTTGEQYKVGYSSNYYWINDPGYMAGTLTQDPPGVGWQEMMQLP
jgi:hypothetical protein